MTYREAVVEGLKQAGAPESTIKRAVLSADLMIGVGCTRQLTQQEAQKIILETAEIYGFANDLTPAKRIAAIQVLEAEVVKRCISN